MNPYLKQVRLNREKDLAAFTGFLGQFGLELDQLEEAYMLMGSEGQILATGGRDRNVLKCFAVSPAVQNENVTGILMTQLFKSAFELGLEDLMIYTRPQYQAVFESFGFQAVVVLPQVCLLHRGPHTVEATLRAFQFQLPQAGEIGSIVMNANPFTFGHQFLVEQAAQQVKALLVFVVEQDDSFFSFQDRYALVKEGCSHLANVQVRPSGPFMISRATFPSYFLKDQQVINELHAQLDATLFARCYARKLNITKRFVGDEPFDVTTAMYNRVLEQVLPAHGVDLLILKRKQRGTQVISASVVRGLLEKGAWQEIEQLVPKSTYDFLRRKD